MVKRWLAMTILALGLLAQPAQAFELPEGDALAIRSVVERQLQAFQRDDAALAFSFASPTIKSMFRTPERFLSMVKNGYAPVYRPQDVNFQDITTRQGRPNQRVLLVGPDGVPVIANYIMERQADGTWLIAGCVLEGSDDLTT